MSTPGIGVVGDIGVDIADVDVTGAAVVELSKLRSEVNSVEGTAEESVSAEDVGVTRVEATLVTSVTGVDVSEEGCKGAT